MLLESTSKRLLPKTVLSSRKGLSLDELRANSATFRAEIKDGNGETVFVLDNIQAPAFWSQQAINIVASKYFYRGEDKVETSVYALVDRVAETITHSGIEQNYFKDAGAALVFEQELKILLLNQMAAFNSPVWFNVGIHDKPQCSACFINGVEDSMESITDLAKTEMLLFKFGSGTGSNLSTLRSGKEWSKKGGFRSSGPVSFMKGFDAFAGVIKSGGKTRRAAKMVILNVDHPDVMDFINCKTTEEKKAHALIRAGYSAEFNKPGGAYDSIGYQNANHSVRVSDEFMSAVERKDDWALKGVLDGKVLDILPAEDIWYAIAKSTWECGDPGVQFDGEINSMHTCPNTARINASNPCSEYMFLDNSACNLASINLLKFYDPDILSYPEDSVMQDLFDTTGFLHVVSILTVAMDILVDMASYPTPAITKNSHEYRPLGLGYANLGAVFMSHGIPYDSQRACAVTNELTSLLTGQAYLVSALLAEVKGPFKGFKKNKAPMLAVLKRHAAGFTYHRLEEGKQGTATQRIETETERLIWKEVLRRGDKTGIRNSQISVIAPTGTIAFMMDCDTTGIEPDLGLIKYKKLVGGGTLKITNQCVERALKWHGFAADDIARVLGDIHSGTDIGPRLESAGIDPAIFDCANPSAANPRSINWRAHLNIMAAAQPYVSGAISKTINMPESASIEDIANAYMLAWKLKLKAVAIYRDNCKMSQPISNKEEKKSEAPVFVTTRIGRKKLPTDRQAIAHKFNIGGHKGYLHVGLYPDGTPGELFVTIAKEGSTVSGLLDTVATLTSLALQNGVPLAGLVSKFRGQKFEPSGFTENPDIKMASSVVDYIFRWMEKKFLQEKTEKITTVSELSGVIKEVLEPFVGSRFELEEKHTDAPICPNCGSITQRNGSCHACPNCGMTTGCSG